METDAQQTTQLCTTIEKCLQHLRLLKGHVLNAHTLLAGKDDHQEASMADVTEDVINEQSAAANYDKIRENIEALSQKISSEYEKLESEAKVLPNQTPNSLMVNKLNYFLLDCATNPQMGDAYANTRSVFDWSDSTASYINFTYELLKFSQINMLTQQRHRKNTLASQWVASNEPPPRIEMSSAQHAKFLDQFVEYTKRNVFKMPDQQFDYRIVCKVLERSVLSAVIELQFFAIQKTRTSDGQNVCFQKCLWLINNAHIEYVHFVAPHEEWHYEEIPGISNRKQVDLSQASRFELYQKQTFLGNMLLNALFGQYQTPWNKIIHLFLTHIARFFTINQQCVRCKRRLHDFSPVVDYSINPKVPLMHSACKNC